MPRRASVPAAAAGWLRSHGRLRQCGAQAYAARRPRVRNRGARQVAERRRRAGRAVVHVFGMQARGPPRSDGPPTRKSGDILTTALPSSALKPRADNGRGGRNHFGRIGMRARKSLASSTWRPEEPISMRLSRHAWLPSPIHEPAGHAMPENAKRCGSWHCRAPDSPPPRSAFFRGRHGCLADSATVPD